jgi:hypothetical protein
MKVIVDTGLWSLALRRTKLCMNLEYKTLLGSLAANSKNPSYRTLRGVGSCRYEPEARAGLKPNSWNKSGVKS